MVHHYQHGGKFIFSVVEEKPNRQKATITVGRDYVNTLYSQILLSQKMLAQTPGFLKGSTPLHYIAENFRPNILEHLKELLFTHCIQHFLYASLIENKIVVIGDPDLVDIYLKPNEDAQFIFTLASAALENDQKWKRLSLRHLERKHYKDLDKQVEFFIKEETDRKKEHKSSVIEPGDWIQFEISLVDKTNNPLLDTYKSSLWISIQGEDDEKDLRELFLGKKVGDSFFTQSVFLQEYISHLTDMEYNFFVEIKDHLPNAYFNIDLFKHHFSLADEEMLASKLVEVFSTRNDITLRREIMEASLKLVCKQFFFLLPHHLVERQRSMVLQSVQFNPDYHVYKSQINFKENVNQLAEKQLKEALIIDAIAFNEGISVSDEDVRSYLNLLKRPRMKEFMHFKLPEFKLQRQEVPLSSELVKRYCLREKTLNYIIKEFTKKRS
ncbi:hypothetical protein H0X06_04630 [Candidatus Dependentiae bacterium]|nr:hypothetical protein [Candidatus Dependentiae bacterium]